MRPLINVNIKLEVSMWDAIKMRIAGGEYTKKCIENTLLKKGFMFDHRNVLIQEVDERCAK